MKIEVRTQKQLEAALENGGYDQIELHGTGIFEIWTNPHGVHIIADDGVYVFANGDADILARCNARVTAKDTAYIVARDFAAIDAWDRSYVDGGNWTFVTFYGHSVGRVRNNACATLLEESDVEAYDFAQIKACKNSRVFAMDGVQVQAFQSATVIATEFVAVTIHAGYKGSVSGGIHILVPAEKTEKEKESSKDENLPRTLP